MKIKSLLKKFICAILCMTIAFADVQSYQPTVLEAATVVYKNRSITLSFKDKKGFKKVTVNGKKKSIKAGTKKVKLTLSKEGMYTVKVTNRKNKSTVKKVCIDKTKPTISGVENGKSYTQSVSLSAVDKYGVKAFSVNGQKISSFKVTVKGVGTYKAIAQDKAGNITEVSFTLANEQQTTVAPVQTAIVKTSPEVSANPTLTPVTQTPAVSNSVTPVISEIPSITYGVATAPVKSELPVNTNKSEEIEVTEAPILPTNTPMPTKEPEVQCDHSWKLVSTLKESTCSSYGKGQYVCETCGGTKNDIIEKLPHNFTKRVDDESCCVKEVTCTEKGQYHLVCENCGTVDENVTEVNPHGHNFEKQIASEKYLKEPATEDHGATYFLACIYCGEKGTDEYTWNDNAPLTHTEHKFTDTSVVSDANLVSPATCDSPAKYLCKCSECDTFSTTDTFEVGTPLGHDFSVANECEEEQKKAPTCSEPGEYYLRCSRCGSSARNIDESKVFTGEKILEHTFDAQVADIKYYHDGATCQGGTEYYVSCSVCGESSKKYPNQSFFRGTDVVSCVYSENGTELKDNATCQHGKQYFNKCKWCGTSAKNEYKRLRDAGKTDKELSYLFSDDGHKVDHSWKCYERSDRLRTSQNCTTSETYWKTCEWCDQSSEHLGGDSFVTKGSLGHIFTDIGSNHYITKEATASEDAHYELVCIRDNCDAHEGIDHIAEGTYTDKYKPLITYKYSYGGSNIESYVSSSYKYSKGYIGSGNQDEIIDDQVGNVQNCNYGVLDINVSDQWYNSNYVPSSNIKFLKSLVTEKGTLSLEEAKSIIKSGNTSSLLYSDIISSNYSNLNTNSIETGLVFSSKSGIKILPELRQLGECYVYIYAEDMKGNGTIIRTMNLFR